MTRRVSLTDLPLWLRLVASLVLIMGIALTATGVTATTALRGYLLHRVDTQLVSYVDSWAGHDNGQPGPDAFRHGPDALNAFYVAVLSPTGVVTGDPIRTREAPPRLPQVTAATVAQHGGRPFSVVSADGTAQWRMVLLPLSDGSGYAAIAVSATGVDQIVHRLLVVEVVGGIAVLLLVAAGTYVAIRRTLRPLNEVEETATAIAAGDLTLRVPQQTSRDEVGRLSTALNTMLGQIEQAFEARRTSEEAARTSEQRMRRFVADASHELRTPLTSIRGFAELYRQGAVAEGEDLHRVMRRVEDEAARMGLLVDELLLLARLDQQRPLEVLPVDLAAVASDTVHDAQLVDPDRPVALHLDALPVVEGDGARLHQVLANLLSNARTHTPPGTAITVTVGADSSSAYVDVADDGPGMPTEQAARVFERFYRADAARTRVAGGSGLGLSIVAALVHAHGGEVELQTAPGDGARFRVRLPLSASSQAASSQVSTSRPTVDA